MAAIDEDTGVWNRTTTDEVARLIQRRGKELGERLMYLVATVKTLMEDAEVVRNIKAGAMVNYSRGHVGALLREVHEVCKAEDRLHDIVDGPVFAYAVGLLECAEEADSEENS